MPSGTFWTAERDAKCVELWQKGYSASQVGKELGLTRNAILGRLNRTGESSRNPRRPSVRLRRYEATPYVRRQKLTRLILADIPAPPQLNAELNIGFLAVKANQCREVVGNDGLAIFCGAPIKPTYPYCAYHHSINYRQRGEQCEAHSSELVSVSSQQEGASNAPPPNGVGASAEAEPGPTATSSAPDSSDIAA